MLGIAWDFPNTALALVILFTAVTTVFHFKFKRDKVSEFDRSLWHLKHIGFWFVALLFAAQIYLPSFFYLDIKPDSGQEAWHDLIVNQQRMAEDLQRFREILNLVFLAAVGYALCATKIVSGMYHERRKKQILEDPRLKKPLGLETN